MTSSQRLAKAPNKLAIVLVRLYRLILSPSVGILRFIPFYPRPACIFHPTCSEYAIAAYQKYGFFTATRKILGRISRCHPGNLPSVDHP